MSKTTGNPTTFAVMESDTTLTEAGKRIKLLERQLERDFKVRRVLIALGHMTEEKFLEVEALVVGSEMNRD